MGLQMESPLEALRPSVQGEDEEVAPAALASLVAAPAGPLAGASASSRL